MNSSPIIAVSHITHRYDSVVALDDVSFLVQPGEIFGLLGPNGGGKSTLFRILSTIMLPSSGELSMGGVDVKGSPEAARTQFAVIFQHPSVDEKLTVRENLRHHGWCYGLGGKALQNRIEDLLSRFKLTERAGDRVETLSGGMRRKVEIAKGLLSNPDIIMMDEPSTGLDPGARKDLWEMITTLNQDEKITFVVTTHLMDEAEHCHKVGILDQGNLLTYGPPSELKSDVGGELIEIQAADPGAVRDMLEQDYDIHANILDDALYFEQSDGHNLIPELMEVLHGHIQGISVRKPTLDDVFVYFTGHRFEEGDHMPEDDSI